jgi:hypothetical protein
MLSSSFSAAYNSLFITFGYLLLVPFLLWFAFTNAAISIPLLTIYSIYGYSLISYIFLLILCGVFPFNVLVWGLLLLAAFNASIYLLRSFYPYVRLQAASSPKGRVLLLGMVLAQIAYSILLKFYFFSIP